MSERFEGFPASGEIVGLQLDAEGRIAALSAGAEVLFARPRETLLGAAAASFLSPMPPADGGEGPVDAQLLRPTRSKSVRVWLRRGERGPLLTLLDLEAASQGTAAEGAALSHFASLVTHEVRNPLSSVKMVVQTFARGLALDERARRRLMIAGKEIRTIERILVALAELTHPRPLRPERLAVAEVLDDVARAAEPELKERGLTLVTQGAEGLPPLRFDRARLALALSQLVAIAAHGLEGGEVALEAAAEAGGVAFAVHGGAGAGSLPSGAALSFQMVEKLLRPARGTLVRPAGAPTQLTFRLLLPADGEQP